MRRAAILHMIVLSGLLISACQGIEPLPPAGSFKQEMRDFVELISEYAEIRSSGFIIIPQNGIELVTVDGEADGIPAAEYLEAIDGNGQEDLYFGYDRDDVATSDTDSAYLSQYLDISRNAGNIILVTDYCSDTEKIDESYSRNNDRGYVSFAADSRELDRIPAYPGTAYDPNTTDVLLLNQVRNFLYLINPMLYSTKDDFISAVSATDYDLIIIDLFFGEDQILTSDDLLQLRSKADGGTRLLVCYMSIGEAEDYRYYWQEEWSAEKPAWMAGENPRWEGNFKVRYWLPEWQSIIFGTADSYLDRIVAAGFDGAYLDIIDAFEYFE